MFQFPISLARLHRSLTVLTSPSRSSELVIKEIRETLVQLGQQERKVTLAQQERKVRLE
jgi:hypothetical protein